jgi:hypothetical protein
MDDEYIAKMIGRRARVAISSGGLESVEDGRVGEHSVFAASVLDVLRSNSSVIDGSSLFNAIRRPVALNTSQIPEYGDIRNADHRGGDFFFVRRD